MNEYACKALHSSAGQRVLDMLVRREIGVCVSAVMTYYAEHSPDEYMDLLAETYDSDTEEYREIYEWWTVSRYLADELRKRGHVVADVLGLTVWGRPTTGQAIAMDGVIAEIAADMEILPGQAHDWSEE